MCKSKISGIYAIKNKVNGKLYVGSSISVHYRWKQQHHPDLKKGIHYNRHLQNAWNKYTCDNFEFQIIEECEESVMPEKEGFWIEHYKSWDRANGYNIHRIIDDRIVISEETRQLMSQRTVANWQKPEVRGRREKAMKGSKTEESLQAISEYNKKRSGTVEFKKKHSRIMSETWLEKKEEISAKMKAAWGTEETRRKHKEGITAESRLKMSEASKKYAALNARPILQLDLDGKLIKEWSSPMPAIREYGRHVSSVLSGKRQTCGGFMWQYSAKQ